MKHLRNLLSVAAVAVLFVLALSLNVYSQTGDVSGGIVLPVDKSISSGFGSKGSGPTITDKSPSVVSNTGRGTTTSKGVIEYLHFRAVLQMGFWFIYDNTDPKAAELKMVIPGNQDPIGYINKYLISDGSDGSDGSAGN